MQSTPALLVCTILLRPLIVELRVRGPVAVRRSRMAPVCRVLLLMSLSARASCASTLSADASAGCPIDVLHLLIVEPRFSRRCVIPGLATCVLLVSFDMCAAGVFRRARSQCLATCGLLVFLSACVCCELVMSAVGAERVAAVCCCFCRLPYCVCCTYSLSSPGSSMMGLGSGSVTTAAMAAAAAAEAAADAAADFAAADAVAAATLAAGSGPAPSVP
jgi:hypothetical protein